MREDVERFFTDHPTPAAERTIRQSLERIRINIAWLERNRAELGGTLLRVGRGRMIIEDSTGRQLDSVDDWRGLHDPEQWRQGRSAYSVADFIVNRRGARKVQERISSVLGEPVILHKLIPEYEVRFDRHGKGRFHDLGIFGETYSGSSLFVGVEAKVDERFGKYVSEEWLDAERKRNRGERTRMPQRIRELCARFDGGPEITEDADIRYQLLYGTAGTVCAGMDVSVFYVAVFLTDDYDSSIGESNYQDYRKFIEQAGGKPTEE